MRFAQSAALCSGARNRDEFEEIIIYRLGLVYEPI